MTPTDRIAAALLTGIIPGIIAAAGLATAANLAAQDAQLLARCQTRDSAASCRLQLFGR
jgi:hypothetical protein